MCKLTDSVLQALRENSGEWMAAKEFAVSLNGEDFVSIGSVALALSRAAAHGRVLVRRPLHGPHLYRYNEAEAPANG